MSLTMIHQLVSACMTKQIVFLSKYIELEGVISPQSAPNHSEKLHDSIKSCDRLHLLYNHLGRGLNSFY